MLLRAYQECQAYPPSVAGRTAPSAEAIAEVSAAPAPLPTAYV